MINYQCTNLTKKIKGVTFKFITFRQESFIL